jgi:hypothetical protein
VTGRRIVSGPPRKTYSEAESSTVRTTSDGVSSAQPRSIARAEDLREAGLVSNWRGRRRLPECLRADSGFLHQIVNPFRHSIRQKNGIAGRKTRIEIALFFQEKAPVHHFRLSKVMTAHASNSCISNQALTPEN